jgi:hypothetical protein
MCSQSDKTVEYSMRCDLNAVKISVFCNPFELSNSAYISRIRAYDPDGTCFYKFAEILPEINLFTCMMGVVVARVSSLYISAITYGV